MSNWWYRKFVIWGKNISGGFVCDYKLFFFCIINENNEFVVDVYDLFVFLCFFLGFVKRIRWECML